MLNSRVKTLICFFSYDPTTMKDTDTKLKLYNMYHVVDDAGETINSFLNFTYSL